MLVGDHGPHMNFLAYITEEGYFVKKLPVLLMAIPNYLVTAEVEENLLANEQKPFTSLDIYWSLRQALEDPEKLGTNPSTHNPKAINPNPKLITYLLFPLF